MSVILGFVQGVAEFLPISSSGHLSLLQTWFGMEEPDNLFNVLLHFATLIAVLITWAHRGNLKRIFDGNERRFYISKKQKAAAEAKLQAARARHGEDE